MESYPTHHTHTITLQPPHSHHHTPTTTLQPPHSNHYTLPPQETFLNITQLSSTWLTVNIAIGRYFAICRPLHAKGFISIKSIRIAIVTIFFFSIFFNLPKFFSLYYDSQDCHQMLYEGGVVGRRKVSSGTPTTQPSFLLKSHLPEYHDYNMAFTGLLEKLENRKNQSPNPDFLESTQRKVKPPQRFIYTLQMDVKCGCRFTTKRITQLHNLFIFSKFYLILTSIFYIFFPLTLLSVCNVCLILALRRSYRMQRLYRANKPNIDNGQRITAVLIVIIMLFIILVIPPDFIIFIKNFISDSNLFKNLRITNLLLLTNFSINFILYFAINTKFRKTFKSLISCCFFCELTRNCPHDSVSQPTSSVTFAHHHAATLQLKSCKSSSLPPKKSLRNMKMFRNSHKQKVSNIEVKITSSPSSSQIMISKLRNSSSKTTNTSESSHKKKSKQFF